MRKKENTAARTTKRRLSAARRSGRPPGRGRQTAAWREACEARALDLVVRMMAIPGASGQEGKVVGFITALLRRAGVELSALRTDQAQHRSPLGGETGNLILKLPGTVRRPRRLLVAHIDTVPACTGSVPEISGGRVRSANPRSGLGADNRAGATVLLSTALWILRARPVHPPLTFLWTVQEEVGLLGARHVRVGWLGKPQLAFNFDGGTPEKLTVGATGGYRMKIHIDGLASHAGGAPEQGVSAIVVAAAAIDQLRREGWHGLIVKGASSGTSNVGVIRGGTATNVVADRVVVDAEARSHDPRFRKRIVGAINGAFQRAAKSVRNAGGRCGRVRTEGRLDYESFRLAPNQPCVREAEAAVRAVGLEPVHAVANGGLDANWLSRRGIPTVSFGCGQRNIHTVREQLDLEQFRLACRIAAILATGGQDGGCGAVIR